MSDAILENLDRGLLTITLNIPERRNALRTDVALGLLAALERASSDPAVRAILLRGAGGTFCVGGDVTGMGANNADPPTFETKLALMRRTREIGRILHEMPKPVVAAVEGAAAGAGLSIAMSADFRVVGENAKITTAFAKVGVSGDYGGLYFITKIVGAAKARELALLSPVLSGLEAHALGLMTKLVADAEVGDVAQALGRSLADGPTVALGYIKKNINIAEGATLDAYLETEALHQCRCLQSEDHKEATAAFVEKRSPLFVGR